MILYILTILGIVKWKKRLILEDPCYYEQYRVYYRKELLTLYTNLESSVFHHYKNKRYFWLLTNEDKYFIINTLDDRFIKNISDYWVAKIFWYLEDKKDIKKYVRNNTLNNNCDKKTKRDLKIKILKNELTLITL